MTDKISYRQVEYCRICGSAYLQSVLNLGNLSFTGLFPKKPTERIPKGPLELVKCEKCHLIQLAHSFDLTQLYGKTYGYRSGLNNSIVRRLEAIARRTLQLRPLKREEIVLDIGSNDGTLLKAFRVPTLRRIGIDPSAEKFRDFYPSDIELITEFFSLEKLKSVLGSKKVSLITSIAMFYDLERPMEFVESIASLLKEDGLWVLEQSYLPLMLDRLCYDTICHEHLEYYGLTQIHRLAEQNGLKIIEIEYNDVNGGSICVMLAKKSSAYPESPWLAPGLKAEKERKLDTLLPYQIFRERVEQHRIHLKDFLEKIAWEGKRIFGYGASTKGNVLLQYCGIGTEFVEGIVDVNPDKFGSFTPGTQIPILSEGEVQALNPDVFLVLPWHFRKGILEREKFYLTQGVKLLFPLPNIELVSQQGLDLITRPYEASHRTQKQNLGSQESS